MGLGEVLVRRVLAMDPALLLLHISAAQVFQLVPVGTLFV